MTRGIDRFGMKWIGFRELAAQPRDSCAHASVPVWLPDLMPGVRRPLARAAPERRQALSPLGAPAKRAPTVVPCPWARLPDGPSLRLGGTVLGWCGSTAASLRDTDPRHRHHISVPDPHTDGSEMNPRGLSCLSRQGWERLAL